MARQKHSEPESNLVGTTLAVFMEAYNQNLPAGFPRASIQALKEFRASHPVIFRNGGGWTIHRHRKRLMDWLSSRRDA